MIPRVWAKRVSSLGMGLCVVVLGAPLAPMASATAEVESGTRATVAQAESPAAPPPPNPEAAPNPVLLGPGAKPEEVTILQRQLTDLGFYTGPVDGTYSPLLQEAVKAFQASVNLPTTGLLDRQTWDRMSTPQLISGASTPQGAPEVPNLLPSSLNEPPPSVDSAASTALSSTPALPAATATPQEVAPNPDSPDGSNGADGSGTPNASESSNSSGRSRADVLTRVPWRWLIVLPVGGGVAWGIRWGWRRRHRSNPILAKDVMPETEEVAGEIDPDALDPAPPRTVSSRVEHGPDAPKGEEPAPGASGQDAIVAQRTEGTRLPTVNIGEALVNELRSADVSVRQRAIWELGQRGNSTAIQPLVNSLMEADSQEKSLIFAALTEIGRRSLQPMQGALALGLQDPSPEVRKNAIRDLSRIYDTLGQISPLLIHATQDPDPEVQAVAHWALGQLARLAPAPYLEASVEPSSSGERLPPASS